MTKRFGEAIIDSLYILRRDQIKSTYPYPVNGNEKIDDEYET